MSYEPSIEERRAFLEDSVYKALCKNNDFNEDPLIHGYYAIVVGFKWERSPEGYDYWSKIEEDYKSKYRQKTDEISRKKTRFKWN